MDDMGEVKKRKKTGGRVKGTPNRVTKNLRERISGFLDDNWQEAVESWKMIYDPKDKVKLYIDLVQYTVPKLQSVNLDATVKQEENTIEQDLIELYED